ncbi:MAG: (Fe-S)-binding protein [Syntrophales bacterium]|nr:(Fe-S)-binding protein [Syntrophales bacterium]
MFDVRKCDFCGECLESCLYLNFDKVSGGKALKNLYQFGEGAWLNKCITCFACNEFCTKGARPFDLILEHLGKRGDYVNSNVLSLIQERFSPKEPFQAPKVKGRILSLCTVAGNLPHPPEGRLFEGLELVRGRHFFCNVLFVHLGNKSIVQEKLPHLVEKYASFGCDEIIFMHDDCYTLMTDLAPQYGIELPFRPVHLFEYLRDKLQELKSNVKPLNVKVAYQRPCASRLTPWKEPLLDEIFHLIGVFRVNRTYDRENSMCCGQDLKGLVKRGDKFPYFQDDNVRDAVASGAQAMVFLCPMCLDALSDKCKTANLIPLMLTDICRLAIGEL